MKNELNQTSVDIILPNYNSAPYLSETIESIIGQTFKNLDQMFENLGQIFKIFGQILLKALKIFWSILANF